jgi:hypothetical protein
MLGLDVLGERKPQPMTTSRYHNRRKEIENNFETRILVDKAPQVDLSPSGQFCLTVTSFAAGPNISNYSRGLVTKTADDAVVTDVLRNYGHFWYTWLLHPNGHEYLLCGEDYQGYSVIELATGTELVHFPDEAFDGGGFCWAKVSPAPDGQTLAVEGCVWGGTYELAIYNFATPMTLPLPELARIENIGEFSGWNAEGVCSFTVIDEEGKFVRVGEWRRG